MKHKFLPITFFTLGLITAVSGFSQSGKYFAVTGEQYGSVNWIAFRQFDAGTKNLVRTLYIPAGNNEAVYDAANGEKIINNSASAATPAATSQTCGCINNRMVAAI